MKCPRCDSTRPPANKGIKRGKRDYQCRDCGHYFSVAPEAQSPNLPPDLAEIQKRFSPEELRLLARGRLLNPEQQSRPVLSFDGDEVVFGFCTDSHWGSKYSPEAYWDAFLEECDKQKVQAILHAGDVTEGMSNRPDQIYSLTHVGYSAQIDFAVEQFRKTDLPIYVIDGNHDRWGIKSGGVMVVHDIAARCSNVHYLGHDEADIPVNGTIWRLWHGEDGSSYATSYRLQKIVESWTGGTKPHVLLTGHTHKQGFFFERNVQIVSGGALCRQSAWMRAKKLANHDGFWILRSTISGGEIKSFSPTWYPFYN